MDNLNDLKAIWLTAKTDSLPDPGEMVRIIRKFRTQKLLKIAGGIVLMLLLIAVMVLVIFFYHSTMLTTRFGEIFIILAGVIYVATNTNSLIRFYKLKDLDNKEFIVFLEHTQKRQLFYHKKTQVVSMAFVASGLFLYIFEEAHKSLLLFSCYYGGLIVYLAVFWFVVRPRVFRREAKKMDERIARFKKISDQINNL